ncbi:MAG: GntR family transcriptional regulator [Erysipelothrix sp.]|nr:GntR family transcriptional regulator [Erysipelothrix sp.]
MSIPLYQVIIDDILNKIETGFYKSGTMLPSENDLCKHYKVSRITSKRALNELEKLKVIKRVQGKGSFVTQKHPNELSSYDILCLIPYPDTPSFGNYSSGFLSVFDEYGLNLHMRDSLNLTKEFVDSIKDKYKGVLYYPQTNEEALEFTSNLLYQGVPCVLLDKDFVGIPYSSITSDNMDGMYLAAKELIENGSKNLKFVTSTKIESHSSVMERFLGFVEAKKEYNHPFSYHDDILIIDSESQLEDLIKGLIDVGCDGIVCENDIQAIRIINKFKSMDLDIIPIIGFDNIQASEMSVPTLSTVQQDFHKIGEIAAQTLIETILVPNTPIKKVKVKTQLIIRQSSQGDTK